MEIRTDWDGAAWHLAPIAANTGPFVERPLLEAWWRIRGPVDGELMVAQNDSALLPLWRRAGVVGFPGESDLFDYHSPLGSDVETLVAETASRLEGMSLELNSLPDEAANVVAAGLDKAGVGYVQEEHDVSAVLDLPADFDMYLSAIGKKERHELRRKRRRFEAAAGPATVDTGTGADHLAEFVHMHRLAPGEKGSFMTDDMARFFSAAAQVDGARIDLLRTGDGVPVAATFGFTHGSGYYLYNSGFETTQGSISPGQVLLSMLIEDGIEQGLGLFDFLKGDEAYKFRLGARRRSLYSIRSTT